MYNQSNLRKYSVLFLIIALNNINSPSKASKKRSRSSITSSSSQVNSTPPPSKLTSSQVNSTPPPSKLTSSQVNSTPTSMNSTNQFSSFLVPTESQFTKRTSNSTSLGGSATATSVRGSYLSDTSLHGSITTVSKPTKLEKAGQVATKAIEIGKDIANSDTVKAFTTPLTALGARLLTQTISNTFPGDRAYKQLVEIVHEATAQERQIQNVHNDISTLNAIQQKVNNIQMKASRLSSNPGAFSSNEIQEAYSHAQHQLIDLLAALNTLVMNMKSTLQNQFSDQQADKTNTIKQLANSKQFSEAYMYLDQFAQKLISLNIPNDQLISSLKKYIKERELLQQFTMQTKRLRSTDTDQVNDFIEQINSMIETISFDMQSKFQALIESIEQKFFVDPLLVKQSTAATSLMEISQLQREVQKLLKNPNVSDSTREQLQQLLRQLNIQQQQSSPRLSQSSEQSSPRSLQSSEQSSPRSLQSSQQSKPEYNYEDLNEENDDEDAIQEDDIKLQSQSNPQTSTKLKSRNVTDDNINNKSRTNANTNVIQEDNTEDSDENDYTEYSDDEDDYTEDSDEEDDDDYLDPTSAKYQNYLKQMNVNQ